MEGIFNSEDKPLILGSMTNLGDSLITISTGFVSFSVKRNLEKSLIFQTSGIDDHFGFKVETYRYVGGNLTPGFGIVGASDYSATATENKLIYAQRQYVDDAVQSLRDLIEAKIGPL